MERLYSGEVTVKFGYFVEPLLHFSRRHPVWIVAWRNALFKEWELVIAQVQYLNLGCFCGAFCHPSGELLGRTTLTRTTNDNCYLCHVSPLRLYFL
jgi:hypothetical protein